MVMLFAAPDMETSMDGNAAVNFLEELEGSLKAVGPGALIEHFAEGWTDAFPTTRSSSVVLLHLPEIRPLLGDSQSQSQSGTLPDRPPDLTLCHTTMPITSSHLISLLYPTILFIYYILVPLCLLLLPLSPR